MGTLVISALDIGSLLIGGIIGSHVKPVVTAVSPEEKALIVAKIEAQKALLDQLAAKL